MNTGKESSLLGSTFVVVDPALRADPIDVTDSFWPDLETRYPGFAGHTLISSFTFDADWPTWHTARIHAPATMLFVTPGEGTENRGTPGTD